MKLVEVYTSVQGEGPNVGKPTTFVRFGGCNLRCPRWGSSVLPDGTHVPSCDTIFAVYPQFRSQWETCAPKEVFQRIPELPKHVCFTGGEPLIQKAREIHTLADMLREKGYTVDLFTNGTCDIPSWAQESGVTIVVDWKLKGSGEDHSFMLSNLDKLTEKDVIKFTINGTTNDLEQARELIDRYGLAIHPARIYIGAVWNSQEAYLAEEVVSRFGNLNNVYFQIQLHKHLWKPDERGR